ncbi:MAG: hypothetical protein WCV90_05350 [Candidatus Woesearchaeota archaeon]
MSTLNQALAMGYERAFNEIKIAEFARQMGLPTNALDPVLQKQLKLSEYLIQVAANRNARGLGTEITYGVLDDLIGELGSLGEGVPEGASSGLAEALKGRVGARVKFYQELLDLPENYGTWQELFRAKYEDGTGYRQAVDVLTISERKIIEFEDEVLRLSNAPAEAVAKRPISKSVYAAAYARRQIAQTAF